MFCDDRNSSELIVRLLPHGSGGWRPGLRRAGRQRRLAERGGAHTLVRLAEKGAAVKDQWRVVLDLDEVDAACRDVGQGEPVYIGGERGVVARVGDPELVDVSAQHHVMGLEQSRDTVHYMAGTQPVFVGSGKPLKAAERDIHKGWAEPHVGNDVKVFGANWSRSSGAIKG